MHAQVMCLVARVVVSLDVDAVVGLTLGLIAHVVLVVFVVTILQRIFCIWRYTLYDSRAGNPSNLSPVSREMISDSVQL